MKRLDTFRNLLLFCGFFIAFLSCDEKSGFVDVDEQAWAEISTEEDHFDYKVVGSNILRATLEDPSDLVHFYDLYAFHRRGDEESSLVFLERYEVFPQEVFIPISNVATALDMELSDFQFRDVITFVGLITSKTGKIYQAYPPESANIGLNILSDPNQALLVEMPIICPLEDDTFTGTYDLTVHNDDGWLWGRGNFLDEEVELIPGDLAQRKVTVDYFGFSVDILIDFKCGSVSLPGVRDTGIGCGGPGLKFGPLEGGIYDPADDDSFNLFLTDNVSKGCGIDARVVEFVFEKVK